MKHAFGIRRLDELTSGGLEDRSFTLVHGPSFSGKEVLGNRFILAGLEKGIPAVNILTTESPHDARVALTRLDPRFTAYEKADLVRFVDAYTPQIGVEDDAEPNTVRVDSLTNFSALMRATEEAMDALGRGHEHQRLLLNSLSILALNTNIQTTFRFLQVFIGRAKRAGATGLLLADDGMHAASDLSAFKALVGGAIETKKEHERNFMHVSGLPLVMNPGWIEYSFNGKEMDLTGSFAAGRIR